LKAW
jgi:predicted sulfurtransferase